jgi:hypothetical protein
VGNIVDAMVAYGMGDLGETEIALNEVDRLIAIGSDGMMRAVARARHGVLEPYLHPHHKAIREHQSDSGASTRRCSA